MAFSDFIKQYSRLDICNLSPDTLTSTEKHKWNTILYNNRWLCGSTAGGCQSYPDTFWTNPQFRIKLEEPDYDYNGSCKEPCCTVIVGLMQKNRRKQKKIGEDLLTIGFSLYTVPKEVRWVGCQHEEGLQDQTDLHLPSDFFKTTAPAGHSDTFVNLREAAKRMKMPIGDYLIVPSTFEPLKDGDFCLRVFSEKAAKSLEVGDVLKAAPYEPQVTDKDVTDDFKTIFQEVAGDKGEVTLKDIQTILNKLLSKKTNLKSNGFSLDTCREMVSLMDMDGTGTLSLVELKTIWMKIQAYMEIFLKVDKDKSGTMDANAMRNALQDAGFSLSNKIQQSIIQRYASPDLTITFDGFISCMIRLETLFKMHKLMDKGNTGKIDLTQSEWLSTALA